MKLQEKTFIGQLKTKTTKPEELSASDTSEELSH